LFYFVFFAGGVAVTIVDSMSFQELTQFVYDDVYSIMLEDSDVFYTNLPEHLEPQDFTNEKFTGCSE